MRGPALLMIIFVDPKLVRQALKLVFDNNCYPALHSPVLT